jgi:hypothetical protein
MGIKLLILIHLAVLWYGTAFDLYPWGQYNFQEHTEDLLDGMREHEHLTAWDSTIERALISNKDDTLILRNMESNVFELRVKDATDIMEAAMKKHPARNDLQQISAVLASNCAMLIDGYWSYEYCHG